MGFRFTHGNVLRALYVVCVLSLCWVSGSDDGTMVSPVTVRTLLASGEVCMYCF